MNGIIIVNKPEGVTSHDVVHKVKKYIMKKWDTQEHLTQWQQECCLF